MTDRALRIRHPKRAAPSGAKIRRSQNFPHEFSGVPRDASRRAARLSRQPRSAAEKMEGAVSAPNGAHVAMDADASNCNTRQQYPLCESPPAAQVAAGQTVAMTAIRRAGKSVARR
jgi:hypothetical protein